MSDCEVSAMDEHNSQPDNREEIRCPFCGAVNCLFSGNIMSEGKDNTVKFKYCGKCSRGYRTTHLGGNRTIMMEYETLCLDCNGINESFMIDMSHPTAIRIKNNFFASETTLTFCKICSKTGVHEIIKAEFTSMEVS